MSVAQRRPLHTSPDGRQWVFDLEHDGGKTYYAIREIVPAELHQNLMDNLAAIRSEWRAGSMIGNTQRHWMHAATLTPDMVREWTKELGDPNTDDGNKAWMKRLNDIEFGRLRASGGKL
ncbi:MAG: hypothetical protein ACR2RF_13890 [Geminicoccaceae bacterium]